MNSSPPPLLVSVRNADEADAALLGGADLIDVKEPTRGPMGKPDARVVNAVVATVAGRRPISIAIGELEDTWDSDPPAAIRYCKVGLSGVGMDWRHRLTRMFDGIGMSRAVAVVYADQRHTGCPQPDQVLQWAEQSGAGGVMIDTAVKDGRGLLDWMPVEELASIAERARATGLLLGLAGSLTATTIPVVASVDPGLIGVRGAACLGGGRGSPVSTTQVAAIKRSLVRPCAAGATCAG